MLIKIQITKTYILPRIEYVDFLIEGINKNLLFKLQKKDNLSVLTYLFLFKKMYFLF